MSVVPIDWDGARASVGRATARVADLLRAAPDPEAPVPGLEWTVGELGCHLVSLTKRYEGFARAAGRAMPASMPELNAQELEELRAKLTAQEPEEFRATPLAELARMLEEGTTTLLGLLPSGDTPIRFYDVDTDAVSIVAIWLDELVVHGLDLARALRRPWSIDRSDALMAIAGLLTILPRFVDQDSARGYRATYEIRPRGGTPVVMTFDDGRLTVTAGHERRVDCRINADPLAFLLVGLGRESRWRAIGQGKLIAYGRRPWLALRFNDLFVKA